MIPLDRPARRENNWRLDCGSASAELVLLLPLLIVLIYAVLFAERGAGARVRLDMAAHQAARAASQTHSTAQAIEAATTIATAALRDSHPACAFLSIRVNGSLAAGSTVTTDITCTIDLHDLVVAPLPGTITLTSRATAPVDVYRSTPGNRP